MGCLLTRMYGFLVIHQLLLLFFLWSLPSAGCIASERFGNCFSLDVLPEANLGSNLQPQEYKTEELTTKLHKKTRI